MTHFTTICLSPIIIAEIDRYIQDNPQYRNRSELMRVAVTTFISEKRSSDRLFDKTKNTTTESAPKNSEIPITKTLKLTPQPPSMKRQPATTRANLQE